MRVIGIGAAIILLALISCGVGSCLALDYAFNYNEASGETGRFFIVAGQIGLLGGAVMLVVGIILAVKAMIQSGD